MTSARDSSAQARGVENGLGPDACALRPGEPFRGIDPQLQDGDSVDQGRAHRPYQSPVLQAVARRDDPGALRQCMLAEPALEQERIERLLDVGRAGRQFIEEQAERFGLFRQQDARRAEDRALADDARNAAHILGSDLRAEQRAAGQAGLARRLIDQLGLAQPRGREQQKALLMGHALDQLLGLTQRDDFVEG
jgi:hypothetical protein